MLIDTASLSKTVDAVHAVHFENRVLGSAERTERPDGLQARKDYRELIQEPSPDSRPNA